MKHFSLFALIGVLALAMTACEPKNVPQDPDTPEPKPFVPQVFPKKHLIEEFTGQGCGYCPNGMDCISDFIANDTNWIVVLHHYGYQADHFSVSGSKTITNKLKVSGAPSMTVNRSKTNYGDGKAVVFHPGYLPYTNKEQFAATTYASLSISNTYDAASRELGITVSGIVSKEENPTVMLTVLVKESGMVDTQEDYYKTYEGWAEFRHTNAVRVFATKATGDTLAIDKEHHYEASYSLTLDKKWVAENCMVVAFLSEGLQPVVQAGQRPVVADSKGGADIAHGGIKPVPVSDFYPEPGETVAPKDYSGKDADELTTAYATYETYANEGFNFWEIIAYNSEASVKVGGAASIPCAVISIFTETAQTTLPEGSYEFNLSEKPGSAWAGFRDDEVMQISGSEFYYISQTYFQQGYLVPNATWLIADGKLTIGTDSWNLDGHARNGAEIHLKGTTAIANQGRAQIPHRKNPIHISCLSQPSFDAANRQIIKF